MNLVGVDYTSAPTRRKPITLCHAELDGLVLRVQRMDDCPSHKSFECVLKDVEFVGIDAPLGQPLPFLKAVFPEVRTRPELIAELRDETMADWVAKCRAFPEPQGKRELFRACDRAAGACSPMKCFFIPVGRMFLRAVQSLDRAGFVLAGFETGPRMAVEIYPTLAVATLTEERSYKTDDPKKDSPGRMAVRQRVVAALASGEPLPKYGLTVHLPMDMQSGLAEDPKADRLDAILAAVQTAWAATQPRFGVPTSADEREGYLVDPRTSGLTVA